MTECGFRQCKICADYHPNMKSLTMCELERSARGCTFCNILFRGITEFAEDKRARESIWEQYQVAIQHFTADETEIGVQIDERALLVRTLPERFLLEIYYEGLKDSIDDEFDGPREWMKVRAGSTISGLTSSDAAMGRAFRWFEECRSSHKRCNERSQHLQHPRRLLNISVGNVRLVEDVDPATKYACLSHCWGGLQPLQTTIETLFGQLNGIQYKELPLTFRNAIQVIRQIGIFYVWIDSLCIVQDDEKDWATEAAKMGDIYAGAAITIAATSAKDSRQGLFAAAPLSNRSTPFRCLNARGEDRILLVRHALNHGNEANLSKVGVEFDMKHPLLRRGWVYQERLLSPRILHFGVKELLWECNEATFCECGSANGPGSVFKEKPIFYKAVQDLAQTSEQIAGHWRWMVESYSELDFSFDKDVLIALAGLARQVQALRKSSYLCGLWKDSLLGDLLWTGGKGRRVIDDTPTWSWVLVQGPIDYGWIGYGDISVSRAIRVSKVGSVQWTYASIVDASCHPAGVNPFGPVEAGASVTIHGPVTRAAFVKLDTEHRRLDLSSPELKRRLSVPIDGDCEDLNPDDTYLCIQMVAVFRMPFRALQDVLLVLKAVNGETGTYTRVGLASSDGNELDDREPKSFESKMTVKIV